MIEDVTMPWAVPKVDIWYEGTVPRGGSYTREDRHRISFMQTSDAKTQRIEWDGGDLYLWQQGCKPEAVFRHSDFRGNQDEIPVFDPPDTIGAMVFETEPYGMSDWYRGKIRFYLTNVYVLNYDPCETCGHGYFSYDFRDYVPKQFQLVNRPYAPSGRLWMVEVGVHCPHGRVIIVKGAPVCL